MTIEEAFEKRHEILMQPAQELRDPRVEELVAAAEAVLSVVGMITPECDRLAAALTPFRRSQP